MVLTGCAHKSASAVTAAPAARTLDALQPDCARQAGEVEDALVRLADRYLWEEVEKLLALALAGRRDPGDALACDEAARGVLKTVARRWAEEGVSTGGSQVFDLAQRALRALVTHYPGTEGGLHHLFGRLEWARATRVASAIGEQTIASERYAEAHRHHVAALRRGDLSPEEARISAREQLEAIRRALDYTEAGWYPEPWMCRPERDGACAVPPPAPVPPDMSDADTQMLAAYDLFLAEPAARVLPEAAQVAIERAELLLRRGRWAQVEPGLREVMQTHQGDDRGEQAGRLLLRSLQVRWQDPGATAEARTQARDKLIAVAAELRALPRYRADSAVGQELPWLRAAAMWQAATEARLAGDYTRCARGLEDMAAEAGPEGHGEATLRHEAAVCHEEGGSFSAAIAGYTDWLARFPGRRDAHEVVFRLARTNERVQNVEDARDNYVRFLELAPQDVRALEARRRSIMLALVTGTVEEAQIEALTRNRNGGDRLLAAAIRFRTEVRPHSPYERVAGWIQRFGRDGGAGRLAIAHVRAAEALMRSSCEVKVDEGLCVEITREETLGSVRARDKRQLALVRAHLQAARGQLVAASMALDKLDPPLAVAPGELAAARRTVALLAGDLGAEAALLTQPPSKYEVTRSRQWFARRVDEVRRMQLVYEGVNPGAGREVVGTGDVEAVARDRFAAVIEGRKAQVFEADIGLLELVASAVAARSPGGSEGAELAATMQRLANQRRGEAFTCYQSCIELVASWGEDREGRAEACRAGLGRLVQRYEARLEYTPDWRGRVR